MSRKLSARITCADLIQGVIVNGRADIRLGGRLILGLLHFGLMGPRESLRDIGNGTTSQLLVLKSDNLFYERFSIAWIVFRECKRID